ncbi:MAG: dienelactone hydrolase family protein [Gemmatimonadota bacterium]
MEINTRDYFNETPVPDAAFEAYRRQFAYDPVPLEWEVEESGKTPAGFPYEVVSFRAAYDGERVRALVMHPDESSVPRQVVLVWWGTAAILNPSVLEATNLNSAVPLHFLLRSQRIVVVPVLKGTWERRDGLESTWPSETRRYSEYVVRWIQDVSRTLDYLETRPEVDSARVAFLGISWGGRMGVINAAVEPRFKAAILYSGGLASGRALPEVDQINYVGRIKIPVLMLNGLRDSVEPFETAQRPLFELLGTPREDKRHQTYENTGHIMPRTPVIRETTDWLDRYLGRTGDR